MICPKEPLDVIRLQSVFSVSSSEMKPRKSISNLRFPTINPQAGNAGDKGEHSKQAEEARTKKQRDKKGPQ
jgi:hypothetical protein